MLSFWLLLLFGTPVSVDEVLRNTRCAPDFFSEVVAETKESVFRNQTRANPLDVKENPELKPHRFDFFDKTKRILSDLYRGKRPSGNFFADTKVKGVFDTFSKNRKKTNLMVFVSEFPGLKNFNDTVDKELATDLVNRYLGYFYDELKKIDYKKNFTGKKFSNIPYQPNFEYGVDFKGNQILFDSSKITPDDVLKAMSLAKSRLKDDIIRNKYTKKVFDLLEDSAVKDSATDFSQFFKGGFARFEKDSQPQDVYTVAAINARAARGSKLEQLGHSKKALKALANQRKILHQEIFENAKELTQSLQSVSEEKLNKIVKKIDDRSFPNEALIAVFRKLSSGGKSPEEFIQYTKGEIKKVFDLELSDAQVQKLLEIYKKRDGLSVGPIIGDRPRFSPDQSIPNLFSFDIVGGGAKNIESEFEELLATNALGFDPLVLTRRAEKSVTEYFGRLKQSVNDKLKESNVFASGDDILAQAMGDLETHVKSVLNLMEEHPGRFRATVVSPRDIANEQNFVVKMEGLEKAIRKDLIQNVFFTHYNPESKKLTYYLKEALDDSLKESFLAKAKEAFFGVDINVEFRVVSKN